ncbi:unnamed protein product [Rodentolepis nana]|uniref:Uncharacterized protein n=1 Tax=Rodentolepis nana TaxID=102285 RepID=A0A3P7T7M3_RODNA|nr:unnamed protein product [Rodentolepis nana]
MLNKPLWNELSKADLKFINVESSISRSTVLQEHLINDICEIII